VTKTRIDFGKAYSILSNTIDISKLEEKNKNTRRKENKKEGYKNLDFKISLICFIKSKV